jgi:C4-dicarboxylate-specific signal transduction histidine kinase
LIVTKPKVHVLIVEDDAVDRMACRRALARDPDYEFVLLEAETGREGLQLTHAHKPDCVLLDYHLPDLNGLEFLAELADDTGSIPVPVMMLTGTDNAAVAVEAMKRGAQDYLIKDVDRQYLELLPAVIQRVLRERRMQTEKKQTEDKLLQAENRARETLEEASRLQRLQTANELATLLAHELNQPLAAIATYAETGKQLLRHTPPDHDKLAANLERISQQSLRAGETIRHLRAFVGRGRLDPVPMDLNAVVRSTRTLMAPKARTQGIDIALDLDEALPPVLGVDVHIEQVLLNLLRNAIDAIRDNRMKNGSITMTTRRVEDMAQVSVIDSGPGIDAAMADKVFEPFSSRKEYGLGVGLRISRSLIEAHGGRLWVEPHTPGGIFHFVLPFAP